MGKTRNEVGFWRAVGRLRLSEMLSVETVSSVALGAGLGYVLYTFGSLSNRMGTAALYVGVAAALVGIVFAGVALVTSLLSNSYLLLLQNSESGVLGFLRPFMVAVGIQVSTVLGAVAYVALARFLPCWLEPWIFGLLTIFFVASCLEVISLMRSIFMHALLRTRFAKLVDEEQKRKENQ